MAAIMLNAHHIDVKIESAKLGAGTLKGHKVAHLTGTTQFQLDDTARKELKDFVTDGGTLIIDSCGGNAAFAQSVESEMDTIFGDDAKSLGEPLPQDSPLYREGSKPIDIAWRTFAKSQVGSLKGGRLRGIKVKDRLAVIYSPEDLSVGSGRTTDRWDQRVRTEDRDGAGGECADDRDEGEVILPLAASRIRTAPSAKPQAATNISVSSTPSSRIPSPDPPTPSPSAHSASGNTHPKPPQTEASWSPPSTRAWT